MNVRVTKWNMILLAGFVSAGTALSFVIGDFGGFLGVALGTLGVADYRRRKANALASGCS